MKGRRRDDKRPPPKPPTADAIWQEHVKQECAKAAVQWLKGTINTQRTINSLSKRELEALTECITSAWIVVQSRRVADPAISDEEREYLRFLLM